MTLINDSKSFSFFEFLDYDLLEKERTEIRHLIFKKDFDYCSKRQKQCTRLYYRRLSFHNDENRNRNYLRILCKWKRENSWEDFRRAAQNDTDTLLQEPRSLCIWVMPLYLMFAFFVVYLQLYLYPNIYFNRQLVLKIVK